MADARCVPYAGLSIVQIARLAQAVKEHFGANWTIQPWLGRLSFRVLVVHGAAPTHRVQDCASIALMQLISLADDVDYAQLCREIEAALQSTAKIPNPFQALAAHGGLLPDLVRASLDARARAAGICWRHPQAGLLTAQPRGGWIASEQRTADLAGLMHSEEWSELGEPPPAQPASVRSMEQLIFHAVLRWRDQVPSFPETLKLRLSAFPDVAGVSGQPRLLHALLALAEGASIREVAESTACPTRLVDALVHALALSGLVSGYALQTTASAESLLPNRPHSTRESFPGLRRIAHFLGIGRAVGW